MFGIPFHDLIEGNGRLGRLLVGNIDRRRVAHLYTDEILPNNGKGKRKTSGEFITKPRSNIIYVSAILKRLAKKKSFVKILRSIFSVNRFANG